MKNSVVVRFDHGILAGATLSFDEDRAPSELYILPAMLPDSRDVIHRYIKSDTNEPGEIQYEWQLEYNWLHPVIAIGHG
jgi:hypothetical protein